METIKVAFSSLNSNKLRSSLTILGIIVGIFSIIAISTVISMLQNSIEDGFSMLGQNTFQIQKFPVMMDHGDRAKFRNRKDITIEQYYELKDKLTEAKAVGGEQWGFAKVFTYGNKETNPNVQFCGGTTEVFPNNKWVIEDGREFNQQDINRYERIAVIGADIAKVLFDYLDPIGKEIKVDGHKLRIVGVLEAQGESFGQSQDNFVVIPVTAYQSMYGKRSRSINITVTSPDRDSYDDVMEKAIGYFRTIRKVPPGEENDFGIFSNESMLTQVNSITAGVKVGAVIIALIALVAAGVGIMNIMLVSVTERTREIGIRKAIGAKKSNIMFQFLTEAVILCQLGGLVGILLGLLVGNLAGSALGANATVPIDWVVIGVMLCLLVGIGFGTYPAYKASSLDPIEALRYE